MTDPRTQDDAAREYCDALETALRTRDVPGPRIGAVLAEVRAHLADSGEDPGEAFGPPDAYAAALTAVRDPEPLRRRVATVLRLLALGLGTWWLVTGVSDLVTGDRPSFGLLPLTLLLAALGAAPWLADQVTSTSRAAVVRVSIAFALGWAALVGLLVVAGEVATVEVPATVPAVVGGVLAVAGWFGGPALVDPVVDPFDSPDEIRDRVRRETRSMHLVAWGSWLVMGACVVLMAVLVDRAGG